jgi:hypothetical protein
MRRVHEATVAVERYKNYIFPCVCVCVWGGCGCTSVGVFMQTCWLTYKACHAQASYYLRTIRLHHIFRSYLIHGTIFGRKSQNIKCVFWFSLQLLFETFLILRRNQRDIVINVKSTRYSCQILKEFEFSRQGSENTTNIKFYQNPSVSRVDPYGRTDGQSDMAKLIVASRNSAKALKNRKEVEVHGDSGRLIVLVKTLYVYEKIKWKLLHTVC